MILVTRHDDAGQPLTWFDIDTRVAHDLASGGGDQTRPFTDRENAMADALLADLAQQQQESALRDQLAAGVSGIQAARTAAIADVAAAKALRDAATTAQTAAQQQRATVAGWVPSTAYKAADLVAIRDQVATVLDRQAAILGALADLGTYRAAVDENAKTTDDALLWLAQLASGLLT